MKIKDLLDAERGIVEQSLRRLFPTGDEWPERFWKAMEYAVFAGGKRIRPVLARIAHRAAGGDPDDITVAACGLELEKIPDRRFHIIRDATTSYEPGIVSAK